MRRLPILIPHRPGCADFPLPVLHGRASLTEVQMTPSVTCRQRTTRGRTSALVSILASSATRCRFVDRFVRLNVLSRVSRQRFSPHGTPLSSIGSRSVRFPDVTGTSEVLRLPATHIRSLICFASGVHAILLASCFATCAPGRSEGTSGPGPLFNRRPDLPVRSHVDVSGTSQVPRRSILCLCPALRPRPNQRSLASLTVSSMLPPRFPRQELQRLMNFGALSRGFGTCCLRFKTGVATPPARLASGWLARLYREGVEPSGSLQKVSDHSSSFSGLSLAQGKFHFEPPSLHSITSSASASNVGGTSTVRGARAASRSGARANRNDRSGS